MNGEELFRKSSKYKGVHWSNTHNKWVAQIQYKGKQTYLGLFKKEDDAAISYNVKATELFGEFAHLNEVLTPTHVLFKGELT